MKKFNIASEKIANIKPARAGEESRALIAEYAPEGTDINVKICNEIVGAQPGDMVVRYKTLQIVASDYRQAIRALDLSEEREEQYLQYNGQEAFRASLGRMLDGIKLWNYAPEKRDEVKSARTYLRHIAEATVEYGSEKLVRKDDIEDFFADEANIFAVAEYYYCVGDIVLPTLADAKNSIIEISHSVTGHVSDVESRMINVSKEKLGAFAQKLHIDVLPQNGVLLAPYKRA